VWAFRKAHGIDPAEYREKFTHQARRVRRVKTGRETKIAGSS
jgi:hypothetical protein